HGSGNLVEGCEFERNGLIEEGGAVKLGPDQLRVAANNRIIGNRAIGNYSGFVLFAAVGYNSRVENNILCNNEADDSLTAGFQDFRGSGNLFVNNIARGNSPDFDFNPATRTEADSPDACLVPPLTLASSTAP